MGVLPVSAEARTRAIDVRTPPRGGRWRRAALLFVASLPMYALLIASAVVILFPLYLTFVDSLQPISKLLQYPPDLWTSSPQWSNYHKALTDIPMPRYLLNSLIMAGVITVGQLVTSILAAYAFSYMRFPGRNLVFVLFLSTMMVPWEASIIPNFQIIQRLNWLDTYQGLTVPFLATAFGTFLLRQHFLTLPGELKDAADIDGYGNLRFLAFVVVPLSRAAIDGVAFYHFVPVGFGAAAKRICKKLRIKVEGYRTYRTTPRGFEINEVSEPPSPLAALMPPIVRDFLKTP
jgi:ABC-type glycerol-3-phosphate transport system permease component